MPVVFISEVLRAFVPDRVVEVDGQTVGQVIDELEIRYPGVRDVLVSDEDIAPGVAISINDQLSQRGLFEPVDADSEVHILPALAGG